jgi:predicted dienelactone hydrolase
MHLRKLGTGCGCLIACVALFGDRPAAAQRTTILPPPTGPLAVGRVTYYWTDEARSEPNTPDELDRRELRVDVWYPADKATSAEPALYMPDLKALSKAIGPEAMILGALRGHALANPPVAKAPPRFGLLVLSPGLGTNGVQYTAIVEELASHGYVVATVDHPFHSRAIAYPDGRIVVFRDDDNRAGAPQSREEALNRYRGRVEPRAADLRFVLDRLERLNAGDSNQPLAGRLDLARVGVLGHSIGGITAALAGQEDARFKAIVNLDGHAASLAFLVDADGRGPRQPLAEFTDGGVFRPSDKQLAEQKLSREEFDRQMVASRVRADEAMRTIAGGSFRVTIPGLRHGSFTDMAMWDPGTPDERSRRIQIVRDYVRAFFDKTLLDNPQTLFDAAEGPYPEVKVERFEPAR